MTRSGEKRHTLADSIPVSRTFPGGNIFLRRLGMSDAEALREAYERNRFWLAPWIPELPYFLNDEDMKREIRLCHTECRNNRRLDFGIFRNQERTLIGRIGLFQIVWGVNQSAGVGYWIDQDAAGQGLTTQALKAALEIAFTGLGLQRVWAATIPANRPSVAVLEKCGFQREGRLRHYLLINQRWQDHDLFSLLTTEFRQQKTGHR